jgi:ubiquinone/menaquinone biosynthesis C-methylase UbiE
MKKRLLKILTHGANSQNFLGSPLIPHLLRLTPATSRRDTALQILEISPHYIYTEDPIYEGVKPQERLKREDERNVASRRQICDLLIAPNLRPDDIVVDFGCGPGYLAGIVAKHCKEIIGVDISCGVIACAEVLNKQSNARYVVVPPGTLTGIPDNSVDVVYTTAVFLHLNDDVAKQCLKDFYRVLKPGGRVIFHAATRENTEMESRVDEGAGVKRLINEHYVLYVKIRSLEDSQKLIETQPFRNITAKAISEIGPISDDLQEGHLFLFEK